MEGNVYWITHLILDIAISSYTILWKIRGKVKVLVRNDEKEFQRMKVKKKERIFQVQSQHQRRRSTSLSGLLK